jgi:hypothetical protein
MFYCMVFSTLLLAQIRRLDFSLDLHVLVLLDLYVSVKCFVENCASFCPLYFGHCIFCVSSNNGW